ncbi:Peptidyl-prolyl cis-trans isomerase FKBP4 [Phytophthora citrophthora]|uniref:Peptidyl-prolyl cis-trans isomerase FKBP4 n=1 Tax=Phytophthora citrophthora TaxID=4793 RepID=A0AAD9GP19_9STRA|nr:Peptidyl-prolyl cis-trans isomerase FKBP4 [Phytophthora citrophthora]
MHDERSCIFETRIERADMCRQRGSEQFKAGDINRAVEWYERALYHVDFDEGTWHFEFTAKNRADVNVVRLPVYLNLAASYLVQGAPKDGENDEKLLAKVIENANLALAIDPENSKGLYRCGWALLLTGELNRAKEKLTKAAKHHPADKRIREALTKLKEKLDEQKKEEKERWGGTLLDKETEGESTTKQQVQVKKPSESNALWMFAVVLIGIALALGQLSFVE